MFKELNILRLFFDEPSREFNVREVARKLKIAPATASKKLKIFAKKEVLILREDRRLDLYKANIDSIHYTDMKRFYTIRKIRESGLIDALNTFYLKPTIVLFGSAAYGMDTETSDIDILVIAEKGGCPSLTTFEKKLKRKIQVFIVRGVKDVTNPHLRNNMLNGITIQGTVQWI